MHLLHCFQGRGCLLKQTLQNPAFHSPRESLYGQQAMSQFLGEVPSDLIYRTSHHTAETPSKDLCKDLPSLCEKAPLLFTTKRPTCYARRTPPNLQDATVFPLGICPDSLHQILVAYFSVPIVHCLFRVFCSYHHVLHILTVLFVTYGQWMG